MCYHSSCYKSYTRFLTKTKTVTSNEAGEYSNAFDVFCVETVEKRIIENREILRMTKLKDIFVKTVLEIDNVHLTVYKNCNLKRRIKSRYPQLHFIKQSQKNKCEVVLCEADDVGVCRAINSDSFTSTDSEIDVNDNAQMFSPDLDLLKNLYSSAIALKTNIENVKGLSCSWPPTGSDLTMKAAEEIIPAELFNFLAWLIGASDDPV